MFTKIDNHIDKNSNYAIEPTLSLQYNYIGGDIQVTYMQNPTIIFVRP